MKIVFLAGPYRADTEYGVEANIQEARRFSVQIWASGAMCFCPHMNTAHFGGALPDEVWLDGDKEMLRRCDAVFAMPRHYRSVGAKGEIDLATELGIPIVYDMDQLRAWIKKVQGEII